MGRLKRKFTEIDTRLDILEKSKKPKIVKNREFLRDSHKFIDRKIKIDYLRNNERFKDTIYESGGIKKIQQLFTLFQLTNGITITCSDGKTIDAIDILYDYFCKNIYCDYVEPVINLILTIELSSSMPFLSSIF